MSVSTRLYSVKGDFYWCSEDKMWKPSEFTRALDWHIEAIQRWFKPNRSGVSAFVSIDDLMEHFPRYRAQIGGNGSDAFTRGLLARNFMLNDPESVIKEGKSGRVTHRRSVGLVTKPSINSAIDSSIHASITSQPCAATGTRTRVECDHKQGRRSDSARYVRGNQRLEDYQPLCAVLNLIKREACARCVHTNKRFDARKIGYTVGWTTGGAEYKGSCVGCYWGGIKEFRKTLIHQSGWESQ